VDECIIVVHKTRGSLAAMEIQFKLFEKVLSLHMFCFASSWYKLEMH
jgi:hypothetical protein